MSKKRSITLGILGLLAGAGVGLYGSRRKLIAKWLGLSPAEYKTTVEYGIPVNMPDGATLITDHYSPKARGSFPTILIRSPYGRGPEYGPLGTILGFQYQRFAERGFHVVVQSTRGRFGSDGDFMPPMDEAADGRATLNWILAQPWSNGVVGTWGPSYLGIAQWALVTQGTPSVRALAPSITSADVRQVFFPDGALALEVVLTWMAIIGGMDQIAAGDRWKGIQEIAPNNLLPKLEAGANCLPLNQADQALLGRTVPYFQEWLRNQDLNSPFWESMNYRKDLSRVVGAVNLMSGWYDFLLHELLIDYEILKNKGPAPYLTIGPWNHFSGELLLESIREGVNWFEATLQGHRSRIRKSPVRVYIMGAEEWVEMENWPPPAQDMPFYLRSTARLTAGAPGRDEAPTTFTYNPADPTPALGGARFSQVDAGPKDNAALESRTDVVLFNSPILDRSLTFIGPVRLILFVKSNLEHTDFFSRLCDVSPEGISTNVCDGLFRITPGKGEPQPDGSIKIEVDMWATAYRFSPGHRIRLQVSSGAHPRWNRNLGTGEPIATGTRMALAHQQVLHDTVHPSVLMLPLIE